MHSAAAVRPAVQAVQAAVVQVAVLQEKQEQMEQQTQAAAAAVMAVETQQALPAPAAPVSSSCATPMSTQFPTPAVVLHLPLQQSAPIRLPHLLPVLATYPLHNHGTLRIP
jgi:hypothetical protein